MMSPQMNQQSNTTANQPANTVAPAQALEAGRAPQKNWKELQSNIDNNTWGPYKEGYDNPQASRYAQERRGNGIPLKENDNESINKRTQQANIDAYDPNSEIIKAISRHLDEIPDAAKQFLAEHLTPEFVVAIGIINGPEVAEYLNQFADPNKVMVPVPRQMAEQYMQQQKGQTAAPQGSAPQAPSQPQPQQAPAPAMGGGMMAPK